MEYCCHVWAGAPGCYLELLDKLQKQICRTVGPSLAVCLEPLAHRRNAASFSHFYRYYFSRCLSELAEVVSLSYSLGRSTCYSKRLHDFSVTIPRCSNDVYANSFFPLTGRLWNSLPIEWFPLTCDLSGFTFKIMWHRLTRLFLNRFPVSFNLFVLLFLVTPCLVDVQLCMEWIPILKKSLGFPRYLTSQNFIGSNSKFKINSNQKHIQNADMHQK